MAQVFCYLATSIRSKQMGCDSVLTKWIMALWNWDPSVFLGCVTLVIAYATATRLRWPWHAASFGAGILALLLALVSPLDTLADEYLFSAHMLQHLLLLLVVPPLVLLGLPAPVLERARQVDSIKRCEAILGRPVVAWLLATGTIWIWHLPVLYNATLENDAIHIVEHLTFLMTATIFWWPILAPHGARLSPPLAFTYLMAAAMADTLLGLLLAYAPTILYSAYLNPVDTLGILSLLRNGWGLTPRADQEIAGLMMWVPGSFPYIAAMFAVTFRWLAAAE